MSSGSFNFNDLLKAADDAGFSVVPPNDYEVEVATAEAKQTSTGKQQIAVRFKIIAGPHAGKSVFNNFVIVADNPNALGFFFRNMAALGVPRSVFETNPPLSQVAAMLVGKRAEVKVSVREWNNQERNQVDSVKASTGGAPVGTGATPFVPQAMPAPIIPPAAPTVVPAPPAVTPTDAAPVQAPDVPF